MVGCVRLRETTFRNFRLHKHFGQEKVVSPRFQSETTSGDMAKARPPPRLGHMGAPGRPKSKSIKRLHSEAILATGSHLAGRIFLMSQGQDGVDVPMSDDHRRRWLRVKRRGGKDSDHKKRQTRHMCVRTRF